MQVGGNIGTAMLSLEEFAPGRHYVIECSSYQIDLAPSLDPSVGVLLNVTPDHLDRHGTIENYAAVKARLPQGARKAIVGIDDAYCRAIAESLRATKGADAVLRISARAGADCDVGVEGTKVVLRAAGRTTEIADIAGIGSLRGSHNAENALRRQRRAAVAARAARRFRHRPLSRRRSPVSPTAWRSSAARAARCSSTTARPPTPNSTEKALVSFPGDIYWILGGKPKSGGIVSLTEHFGRVAKAYLIGEATDEFAATLDGKVVFERCGTLEAATAAAARDAAAAGAREPVVLLSPACASFDQFRNFEVRGEAFRALVAALPGIDMKRGAA